MKFQLKTLLIATAVLGFCLGVFVAHRNSINRVLAIEKQVEAILEDTTLELKAQWEAEVEGQATSNRTYHGPWQDNRAAEVKVFRGIWGDPRYCSYCPPTRYREIGGVFRGSTFLARTWGMTMTNPNTDFLDRPNDESERDVYIRVVHRVPWRLFAAAPETTVHDRSWPENDRFLDMFKKRMDQAGIQYSVIK